MAGDSAVSPRAINGSRDGANYKLIRGTWPVPLRVKVRQTSGLSFLYTRLFPHFRATFYFYRADGADLRTDQPTAKEIMVLSSPTREEGSAILMTRSFNRPVRREKLSGTYLRAIVCISELFISTNAYSVSAYKCTAIVAETETSPRETLLKQQLLQSGCHE